MKNFLFITLLALTLFSCKHKYTLEELRESVKNDNTELFEKILPELPPLERTEMEDLAELALKEKQNFKIAQTICDNGLSVDTYFKHYKGGETRHNLFFYAIEYQSQDFLDYLLKHNANPFLLCVSANKIEENALTYCLYRKNFDYFYKILNSLSSEKIAKENLWPTVENLCSQGLENELKTFLEKDSITANLYNDEKFVKTLLNYDKYFETITKYLDSSKLNFSKQGACICAAIETGKLDYVKWVVEHGVSPTVEINEHDGVFIFEEKTPKDYALSLARRATYGITQEDKQTQTEMRERRKKFEEIAAYLGGF